WHLTKIWRHSAACFGIHRGKNSGKLTGKHPANVFMPALLGGQDENRGSERGRWCVAVPKCNPPRRVDIGNEGNNGTPQRASLQCSSSLPAQNRSQTAPARIRNGGECRSKKFRS